MCRSVLLSCKDMSIPSPSSPPKGLLMPTFAGGSVAVGLNGFESCDVFRLSTSCAFGAEAVLSASLGPVIAVEVSSNENGFSGDDTLLFFSTDPKGFSGLEALGSTALPNGLSAAAESFR